ncbi:MAG: phosphoglucosamine mutase [Candidatus Eremiobacterota bacterium]
MGKLFGTDGVRGIANKDLTPALAFKLARVCGYILSEKKKNGSPYFIIGKDTRISSDMLEHAIVSGLCSVGVSALKLGVVPTPVVSFLTSRTSACGGVMISASHNPFPDNGIKFFSSCGFKLEDREENEIETLLEKIDELPFPEGKDLGRVLEEDILHIYLSSVKENIFNLYDGSLLKGLKIVIDCANGASFVVAPAILKELGADVIEMNISPDGININDKCGSTCVESLSQRVVYEEADTGFAFDGDGDRVISVDRNGRTIDGDKMMFIIASYLKDKGMLKNNLVVSTVMSNLGFELALKKKSIQMVRTNVGDRYVLEEMIKNGGILGGEQSGHIILLDYNNTGDGLITALMLLKVMLDTGKPLETLGSEVVKYPQILVNIPVMDKNSFGNDLYLRELIEKEEKILSGRGRILVRPSGTEPLVRVMVEALDKDEMNDMAERISSEIRKRLC